MSDCLQATEADKKNEAKWKLRAAIFDRDEQTVTQLCSEGTVDVNEKLDSVVNAAPTPLAYASSYCHGGVMRALLRAGANPNGLTDDYGNTCLHLAVALGHANDSDRKEAIQILLAAGASKTARDSDGCTPAASAAWKKMGGDIVAMLQ